MAKEDLIYQLALSSIKGAGPVIARNLVSYSGGVKEVFTQTSSFLEKIPGVGRKMAVEVSSFKEFDALEREIDFIEKEQISCLFYLDQDYPYRLKHIPDAPIILFNKGSCNLSSKRMLAIVGTRKPSQESRHFCRQLIQDLSPYECTIVSGLAYGIDITAHRAALEANLPTIGVLGHGLDRIYPAQHHKTAMEMLENNGALLTEYVSGTKPDFNHFPMRNRIVAGMCDAVIVIESASQGGSMITAGLAFGYDREVMAVPAAPGMNVSNGCNHLIKHHKAHLIENAEDVARVMNYDIESAKTESLQPSLLFDLEPEMQSIITALQNGVSALDELLFTTKLNSSVLALKLVELEFSGWIKALPGKKYQLLKK